MEVETSWEYINLRIYRGKIGRSDLPTLRGKAFLYIIEDNINNTNNLRTKIHNNGWIKKHHPDFNLTIYLQGPLGAATLATSNQSNQFTHSSLFTNLQYPLLPPHPQLMTFFHWENEIGQNWTFLCSHWNIWQLPALHLEICFAASVVVVVFKQWKNDLCSSLWPESPPGLWIRCFLSYSGSTLWPTPLI